MTTLTKTPKKGDLLKWEVEPKVTRGYGSFTPGSGADTAAGIQLMGLPVTVTYGTYASGGKFPISIAEVRAGDEANINALIIDDRIFDVAATVVTDAKMEVLMKGPALINANKVKTTDLAGDAYTMSTVFSKLFAAGIIHQPEPAKQSEQTT